MPTSKHEQKKYISDISLHHISLKSATTRPKIFTTTDSCSHIAGFYDYDQIIRSITGASSHVVVSRYFFAPIKHPFHEQAMFRTNCELFFMIYNITFDFNHTWEAKMRQTMERAYLKDTF